MGNFLSADVTYVWKTGAFSPSRCRSAKTKVESAYACRKFCLNVFVSPQKLFSNTQNFTFTQKIQAFDTHRIGADAKKQHFLRILFCKIYYFCVAFLPGITWKDFYIFS